ncbi:hypothetical protein P5G50_05360 [Leifsonia sp. F6_8S_P_1B]|uniref:Uncharacterized protein n=1 Tax=Leifsonia williamsii TaxID=3035919 RepID=A0ABT8KAM6_9MICO|nr:hypothetical protein [Leifsonia williamsii]MDN4613876.1 hypothetical protein [Leifsonia williamsii]
MRRALPLSAAVAAATIALATLGSAPAHAAAEDPLAAVAAADPTALTGAAPVETTESGVAAIDATIAGTDVTVPVDPSDGVSLGIGDNTIGIGLPFAADADRATAERAGVVSYDNNNGSVTVPSVQADGSIQITTVIAGPAAPKRYTYPLSLPAEQELHLAGDGSVVVSTAGGDVVTGTVAAPWAKDANGAPVATHYEIDGTTLVQVVDFTERTAFPVVADPSITFGTYVVVTMSQATAQAIHGGSVAVALGLLSLTGPVGMVIGAAVYGTIGSYNSTRLGQCRTWSFSYTYLGQLVRSACA